MIGLDTRLPHFGEAGGAMLWKPLVPSHEEEIAAARQEAAAEARQQAEEEFAEQLKIAQCQHAEELEAARKTWSKEEGERLAGLVTTQIADAAQGMQEQVAAVLSPFVGALIPAAAMAELESKIAAAMADDLAAKVSLNGPKDLAGQVESALAAKGICNVAVTGESAELQARIGEQLIATRLAEWLSALRGAADG